jgi:hypothetical protein
VLRLILKQWVIFMGKHFFKTLLIAMGIVSSVKDLKGGFKSWEEHSYPVEK